MSDYHLSFSIGRSLWNDLVGSALLDSMMPAGDVQEDPFMNFSHKNLSRLAN